MMSPKNKMNNHIEDQGDVNDEDEQPCDGDEMSEGAGSEDDDLIRAVEKEPNWRVDPQIKKFIEDVIDCPLPEEVQKQLNDDFVPGEDL